MFLRVLMFDISADWPQIAKLSTHKVCLKLKSQKKKKKKKVWYSGVSRYYQSEIIVYTCNTCNYIVGEKVI